MNILKSKKEEDFSKWYDDLIEATHLIDSTIVQGSIVYSDYCLAIWEQIKKFLNERLSSMGFREYYFPTLIPLSSFRKEKRHFDDFFRETLIVSKAGQNALKEDMVIRPTSESIIYESFAKWIKSKEDLPLLVNQYCSVFRWESLKPNMPLIRENEFLWQESHSVHANEEEADDFARKILSIYLELIQDYAAMPVVQGFKPYHRMFPGAKYTLALEALMPDLKSVQLATSHSLGQNFSSAFGIKFMDKRKEKTAWQACNGITTRLIGAMIMLHSDNYGFILPSRLAPYQCILIGSDESIKKSLEEKGIRCLIDRSGKTKEEKIEYWKLMGAPVIAIKGKEKYEVIRRDTLERKSMGQDKLADEVPKMLGSIQKSIFEKAKSFSKRFASQADSWVEFETAAKKGGFITANWCGEVPCAKQIKEKTKNSLRVVNPVKKGRCIHCNKGVHYEGIFAPAY